MPKPPEGAHRPDQSGPDLFLFQVESGVNFRVSDNEVSADIAAIKSRSEVSGRVKGQLEKFFSELAPLRVAVGALNGNKEKALRNLAKKYRALFTLLGPLFKQCFNTEKYPLHDQPLPRDWENKNQATGNTAQTSSLAAVDTGPAAPGLNVPPPSPQPTTTRSSIAFSGNVKIGFDDRKITDKKTQFVLTMDSADPSQSPQELLFPLLRSGKMPEKSTSGNTPTGGVAAQIEYAGGIVLTVIRYKDGTIEANLREGNKFVYGSRDIKSEADLEFYFVGIEHRLKNPPEEVPPLPGTTMAASNLAPAPNPAPSPVPRPVPPPAPPAAPTPRTPPSAPTQPPAPPPTPPAPTGAPAASPAPGPQSSGPDIRGVNPGTPDRQKRKVPLIEISLNNARSILTQCKDQDQIPVDIFEIKDTEPLVEPAGVGEAYYAVYWRRVFEDVPEAISLSDFLRAFPPPGSDARPVRGRRSPIEPAMLPQLGAVDEKARAEGRGAAYLFAAKHLTDTVAEIAKTIGDTGAEWRKQGKDNHQAELDDLLRDVAKVKMVANDEDAFYPAYHEALIGARNLMTYLYRATKKRFGEIDKDARAFFEKHKEESLADERSAWNNRSKRLEELRRALNKYDEGYKQGDDIRVLFANFDSFSHQVAVYTESVDLLVESEIQLEQLVGRQKRGKEREARVAAPKPESRKVEADPRVESLLVQMYGDEYSEGRSRGFERKYPFNRIITAARRAGLSTDIWAAAEVQLKTVQLAFSQAFSRRDFPVMLDQYNKLAALDAQLDPQLREILDKGQRI